MYAQKFRYLLNSFEESAPIKVFDVGRHKTPPCHVYGPAVRPYYLLHLIVKGKGYVERNGEKTYLKEGEAFLICPGEITTYCSDKDDPWEYVWISFLGSYAKTLVSHATKKLFVPYKKSGLIALLTAIDSENTDCLSILSTLIEVLKSIKIDAPKPNEDGVELAVNYLENNYFRRIDVGELAKKFGFSRSHFTMLFIKRVGESPYEYLTKIRVDRAKEYLKRSVYSVEEIAYSVGFSSLQRFSDTFKKYVGLSPLNFKKSKKD